MGLFEALVSDHGGSSRGSGLLFAMLSVIVLLPLRDYLQSSIDRVFFRTAYDFRRLVETSSQRLASVVDLEEIASVIERAVGDALHPTWFALDLCDEDRGGRLTPLRHSGEVPAKAPTPSLRADAVEASPSGEAAGGVSIPFVVEGQRVAQLWLGPPRSGRLYNGDDRRLLITLAHQSAVAIQNAQALEDLRLLNRDLEEKVEERTAELSNTLDELRTAQGQLVHQEKMASVGQLVAGIAHEINNPVNFIQGNLHFIREYAEAMTDCITRSRELAPRMSDELRESLLEAHQRCDIEFVLKDLESTIDACEDGVERTTGIVQGLRTFSRLDDAEASLMNLHEALDSTLILLRSRLTGLRVEKEYGEVAQVECLAGQISQVFMNLLSNAADAVGESGRIVVRTRQLADWAEVDIEDDGCGIPEAQRDHIFEPFFTTKDVGRGTGLGLSITYGVVVRHGGKLSVRSAPGEGTCFTVQLPMRFSPPSGGA